MSAILAQYMKALHNKDMLVLERRVGTYHLYNYEIGLPFDDSLWPRMPRITVEVKSLCLVHQ